MAIVCGWLLAVVVCVVHAGRRNARMVVPPLASGVLLPVAAIAAVLGQRVGFFGAMAFVPWTVLIGTALFAVVVERRPPWGHLHGMVAGGLAGAAMMRLGCAAIHDHPGRPTSFALGMAGICQARTRPVMGLYELLLWTVLAVLVGWAKRGAGS